MASTTPKVVLLRGDPIYGEGTAAASITPGKLVAVTGGARTMDGAASVALAGAAANAAVFALEDSIGGDIDTAIPSGDSIRFMHMRKGDWVYAWLAAGQDVAAGALLSAGASGNLVAATPFAQDGTTPFAVTPATPVIAKALEAVDNDPGTGGAAVRIKVEIV